MIPKSPATNRHSRTEGGEGQANSKSPKTNHPVRTRQLDKKRNGDKPSSKHNSAVSRKKNKKKKSPEHPLSVEFRGSLEKSTSSITAQLVSDLSNAHQIRLSRIAAATSKSQEYLDAATQIIEKFESAMILSPALEENIANLQAFFAKKQASLDELFKEHQSITEELKQLRQEATEINSVKYSKKHYLEVDDEDDANGTEFMEEAIANIRGVGRKWVGRLEESERKFQREEYKQSQLAAAAMLLKE
ncbi:hypothetical protein FN846DRAFT_887252 [Sphaerosporella brunnea]|uniref:Uncharacterized protein n=1 Tax=Sphaerosporella brunnea TaxID=1250544 RepID=A0A5J5F743_9PEZI|nr:hypothetical protein FN846DRAFT_887252 [Sphaerosporella brunnea]